jgi:hypothetical protein
MTFDLEFGLQCTQCCVLGCFHLCTQKSSKRSLVLILLLLAERLPYRLLAETNDLWLEHVQAIGQGESQTMPELSDLITLTRVTVIIRITL